MKFKVTTESTCDLSQVQIDTNNIGIVHLIIVKDGKEYQDAITITTQDIFDHVAAGGELCTTAAVNIADYRNEFSKYADDYDGVIHISIGSGFSSCYQNACLAAAEFDNVRVIDSCNLSSGQGLLVMKACELAHSYEDIDKICKELCQFVPKIETSFLLNRLDYMVKGGRCSTATALGANLLNLKPCIEVKNGKMVVVKKYRGNYNKCLTNYVKDRLANRDDLDRSTLFITHTPVSDSAYQAVVDMIAQQPPFADVYETNAGCTVSCHCGPGTLGILFARK